MAFTADNTAQQAEQHQDTAGDEKGPVLCSAQHPGSFALPCGRRSLTSSIRVSSSIRCSAASLRGSSAGLHWHMAYRCCCLRRRCRIRCCRRDPGICCAAVGADAGAAVCGWRRAAIQICSLQLSRHSLQPEDRGRFNPKSTGASTSPSETPCSCRLSAPQSVDVRRMTHEFTPGSGC
jgi:hypothetical protein